MKQEELSDGQLAGARLVSPPLQWVSKSPPMDQQRSTTTKTTQCWVRRSPVRCPFFSSYPSRAFLLCPNLNVSCSVVAADDDGDSAWCSWRLVIRWKTAKTPINARGAIRVSRLVHAQTQHAISRFDAPLPPVAAALCLVCNLRLCCWEHWQCWCSFLCTRTYSLIITLAPIQPHNHLLFSVCPSSFDVEC